MIKTGVSNQGAVVRKQNTSASCNKSTGQNGSALIITLLLIAILTGLVVDFVYEVYIDSSSLSNWSNAQRASLIARSGQVIGTEFIIEIKKEAYTDKREVELPIARDFGPGTALTIKIEDENSRFDINSIVYEQTRKINEPALASLKKMLDYLNINPNLASSFADWIDSDSEPLLYNSEDFAKNEFLWSIDELRLINGVNKEIFDKISPDMTIYKNINKYDPVININTAEIPVLISLHPDMTETLAKNIIDHRKSYPFENINQVPNVSGMGTIGQLIQGKIDVKASNFRVTSKATVNGITRIIESVMDSNGKILFWREG